METKGSGCHWTSSTLAPVSAPPLAPEAAAGENVLEGLLELDTETRVDHGVDAAVHVAQPEAHLEHGVGGLA